MTESTEIYLNDIAFRSNALVDHGVTASLDEVHQHIEQGDIIEWVSEKGADMSILLSGEMDDVKSEVVRLLQEVSGAFQGRERRKLGVENNGLCLLIALTFEARLRL